MTTLKWIYRDGGELVCFCACKDAPMGPLPQLDCPWCGCGWLFTCANCSKAFTFGRVAEIESGAAEAIARKSLGGTKATREEIEGFIGFHAGLAEGYEIGERVVILDGCVIPVSDEGPVEVEGLYARHNLPWVPQVQALKDPSVIDEYLGNEEYWVEHKIEEDEEDE